MDGAEDAGGGADPIGPQVHMEIYASSRPQDGGTINQDAFLIGRGERPYAALADGSGNAQQVARRALGVFERLIAEAEADQVALFSTWENWVRLLDSALLGGPQSTFLAMAALEGRVVGACAGDSRLYLLTEEGEVRILTEEAPKARLGSGQVAPLAIHQRVRPGEVLLLMSDGAWTPLSLPKLQALRAKALHRHPSELPALILDEAGKHGRADDMTAVVVRC